MLGNTLNRRLLRTRLAAGALLSLACAWVHAAPPDDADDPLARLLVERNLVEATPTPAGTVRDRASEMVLAALNFLDVPYRYGGNGAETGFDCSGFTRHVFDLSLGLALPRRVDEQASAAGLVKVSRADLQPGDLVFFNTLRRTYSHVGIYIGDGRFVHSPRSGSQVRVEDMRSSYWRPRYTGARRAEILLAERPARRATTAALPSADPAETARVLY